MTRSCQRAVGVCWSIGPTSVLGDPSRSSQGATQTFQDPGGRFQFSIEQSDNNWFHNAEFFCPSHVIEAMRLSVTMLEPPEDRSSVPSRSGSGTGWEFQKSGVIGLVPHKRTGSAFREGEPIINMPLWKAALHMHAYVPFFSCSRCLDCASEAGNDKHGVKRKEADPNLGFGFPRRLALKLRRRLVIGSGMLYGIG